MGTNTHTDGTFAAASPVGIGASARTRLAIDFEWSDLGPLRLRDRRLLFPRSPEQPGVYRFDLGDRIYIGETEILRRRFQHYRTPGPRQSTNIRLNQTMTGLLASGATIAVAIVIAAIVEKDGVRSPLDLNSKSARLLVESAALVSARAAGVAVENL
jgi:hypothetical protein